MRAKEVNENVNFERGQDPKEAMGIGIKDFYGYVEREFEAAGLVDKEDQFWEEIYDYAREEGGADTMEDLLGVLGHTPLEYQIEYISRWVSGFIESNE